MRAGILILILILILISIFILGPTQTVDRTRLCSL